MRDRTSTAARRDRTSETALPVEGIDHTTSPPAGLVPCGRVHGRQACPGLETRPSLMLHRRNTIPAQHNCTAQFLHFNQHPTPRCLMCRNVQAYREIRSRLTLGRRALRVRSFSGCQASRRNSNATVRRVSRMCAGRGMSQIGGQGATWWQCGVSHPPNRRSDLFSWPLEPVTPTLENRPS